MRDLRPVDGIRSCRVRERGILEATRLTSMSKTRTGRPASKARRFRPELGAARTGSSDTGLSRESSFEDILREFAGPDQIPVDRSVDETPIART